VPFQPGSKPNLQIIERGDELDLILPARTLPWLYLPFSAVLTTWAIAAYHLVQTFLAQKLLSISGFLVCIFILIWITFPPVMIYRFLRFYTGSETVTLTPTHLQIGRNILGIPFSSRYALANISACRISFQAGYSDWFGGTPLLYRSYRTSISFAYNQTTIRFAIGVKEPEASTIVGTCNKYLLTHT
jgi:hypothetical protein